MCIRDSSYSMQKTALKKIKYSKNETILNIDKNGLHPWAIAFAKSSVWVTKYNCTKHTKNDSIITLQLFYAKNRLTKIKYSKNETILSVGKMCLHPWAIAFPK